MQRLCYLCVQKQVRRPRQLMHLFYSDFWNCPWWFVKHFQFLIKAATNINFRNRNQQPSWWLIWSYQGLKCEHVISIRLFQPGNLLQIWQQRFPFVLILKILQFAYQKFTFFSRLLLNSVILIASVKTDRINPQMGGGSLA